MVKAKKKLLPKDFEALLGTGDLPALKAVFDQCDVNARGGYTKRPALAFNACSDELSRWLVAQGADITAQDTYGETPLHSRAGHWRGAIGVLLELGADVHARDSRGDTPLHRAARIGNVQTVRQLLDHGAQVDALNSRQLTPLASALQECSNAKIEAVTATAELLLTAPPPKQSRIRGLVGRFFGGGQASHAHATPDMKVSVRRIGTDFEFHRQGFNRESVDATSAALDRLYALFGVPPVPRRLLHDGKSSIVAKAARWKDRHQELWELLVPSSGAAQTVQGEVIRITGRIRTEIDFNGGINWDADFRKMAQAFLGHIGSGVALSEDERNQAGRLVSQVKGGEPATTTLCELAVKWVALNPEPMALAAPDYMR